MIYYIFDLSAGPSPQFLFRVRYMLFTPLSLNTVGSRKSEFSFLETK